MTRLRRRQQWLLGAAWLLAARTAVAGAATLPSVGTPTAPVIVGEVLAVHARLAGKYAGGGHLGPATRYHYKVRVLAALPSAPRVGPAITIVGLRAVRRSWSVFTPVMKPNVYFVMPVFRHPKRSTNYTITYWTLAGRWLPLGVRPPSPVASADVAKLRAAVALYARLAKAGTWPTKARIAKLRHSKNYYLWSLGTWLLAKRARRSLVKHWLLTLGAYDVPGFRVSAPQLSPRRAFWLAHCIRHVVPKSARPARGDVSTAIIGYLRRLAQPHEAGYGY